MADIVVSNLNDSGAGSLRDAIQAANASGDPSTISFSVTGTITLQSGLPAITVQTSIVAGASDTIGTAPTVGIDCNGNGGLVFGTGSAGSELSGLAIGGATGNGVTLNDSGITLNNNYVGLALDGSALGNTGDGVYVSSTSGNNNIGYNPDATSGVVANVISNNGGNGISFNGSSGNTVVSNRIGTSVDGTTAMANGSNGILVTAASNGNTIGGTAFTDSTTGQQNDPTGDKGTTSPTFVTPPLGNLISGNGANGVLINANSQNNVLNGNFIGTDATGNTALGNVGNGVAIVDADNNSLIGCDASQNPFVYYNVIGGNGENGLLVTDSNNVTVQANFIGVGANNAVMVANGNDGLLVNGSSQNTQVGGVIPLGNVIAGNTANGIEVADTASGFITFNTFAGTYAFGPAAPNGNDGVLITSTGGNNTVRTNVISGNGNNGLEIGGDASGVTVVPNIIGLDTRGDTGGTFGNFNDGILITGTAHDNTIGGTGEEQLSVIRQNTVSNNGNYGIEINGAAYNNVVADTAIGTDIQELTALGNANGGVYLGGTGSGNVIGTATAGTSPAPSPSADVNIISGNGGPGVIIASGTNGDAVVNNWIGLNIAGQGTLPNDGGAIQNDGGYNVIYGNALAGGLPAQSPTLQLEALFVGWFGRAAAPAEFNSDLETVLTDILDGSSLSQAMLGISEAFATAPEEAPYAELASLAQPVTDPTPEQIALTNQFIDQTYTNLFGHSADTSEETTWRTAFFEGDVTFAGLVYEIAQAAGGDDATAENSKIDAAAYFTTAVDQSHAVPTPSELTAAVSGVVDTSTELASQAATDALVSSSHSQITYQSILSPGDIITGVRADLYGSVILTGSHETGSGASTESFIYEGPLSDTSAGTMYVFDPVISGQTITTATFYGPDTSIFDPSLGLGNIRAVGSYQYSGSPEGVINHGMMYQGPANGSGGTWSQIDVPADGSNVVSGIVLSAPVEDTILHSTQGNLIVGNYDLQGPGGTLIGANGFIYNIATQQYTLMQVNGSLDNLTSLYGIWQDGIGSTTYTIAGGTNDSHGVNVGFLEDYDSATGVFSNLTLYSGFNDPGVITHFENITAVPGGFDLVATTDSGPAFAFIPVNPDGTFGSATWVPIDLAGTDLLTGNIAYQNTIGGIYSTSASSGGPASYLGTVDLSFVTSDGGLVMPVGSFDFAYALSVNASEGATISGSTSAGNMLGGSIGNDTFIGTSSTSASDTIFTGGGSDSITLATSHTASDRIELYAANGLNDIASLVPGGVAPSVSGSIVDANDVPQLGWWGQATAQFGGPISDASTNTGIGTGTSQDMSTVVNFASTDTIDLSLAAFSGLLRDLGGGPITPGTAIFSDVLAPGGTVDGAHADADVLLISGAFADAAAVADALESNPITFALPQTGQFNHYIIAYQDLTGDVRIADMDIHLGSASSSFTNTAGGTTLAISDMAELSGVTLAELQEGNITFLVGAGTDVVSGQTLTISGGQTSSGLVIQQGGTVVVLSGGLAIDTDIVGNISDGGGGLLTVSSGGVASGVVVEEFATLSAHSGATIVSAYLISGITNDSKGVVFSNTSAVDGGELDVIEGSAIGTTLGDAGTQAVYEHGVASATTVGSGGLEYVYFDGVTNATVVESGGTQTVATEGIASGSIIMAGGNQTISTGGTAVDTILASGATLTFQGGAASGVTYEAGAIVQVDAGATLSGFDVQSGVTFEVLSGTSAHVGPRTTALDTSVESGGTMVVQGHTTASGTVVSSGGLEEVFGNPASVATIALDFGATILGGGLQTVGSGAAATDTVILSGGQQQVSSGALANGADLLGGLQVIGALGVASDTTVGTGGIQLVEASGSAVGTIVQNGGMLALVGGAMVLSTTYLAGATLEIGSGYSLSNMNLMRAQTLEVGSGATATATTVGSGALELVSGGTAGGTNVLGGGSVVVVAGGHTSGDMLVGSGPTLSVVETVSAAGVASAVTLSNTGVLTVLSGGSAVVANIGNGGSVVVMSGGSATSVIVSNGGTATLSGGAAVSAVVKSGATLSVVAGIDSAATVSNGGKVVLSGGADLGITVLNGGQEVLSSGGSAGGTIVSSGGLQVVLSGAAASGSELENGGVIDISGGINISATVSSGGQVFVSGGVDSATVVFEGGLLTVLVGGHTSGSDIRAGGREVVSSGGSASVATVVSGGEVDVLSGGTASGTILGLGGREFVRAGGTTQGTQVGPDGLEIVSSGGQSIGAVLSSGGGAFVSSGGLMSGAMVLSGSGLVVLKGGVASTTTVGSGGQVVVSSGGADRNATVSAGGEEVLWTGGTASGTTVLSGGAEIVSSGAVAQSATLSSGQQVVERGGIANGTVVSGGEEDISGTANGTVVSAGGSAAVSSGGQANGLVIGTGGSATVLSGGAVSGVTLSGGTLEVDNGGAVNSSTIAFSGGGTLELENNKFRGKIAGFNSTDPDSIDLLGLAFQSGSMTLGYTGNSLSGTLSVSDGTQTVKLTMIGNYLGTVFQATADDSHVGTLITVSGLP